MIQPGFKRFDSKLLSAYVIENIVSDLREDQLRSDFLKSLSQIFDLEKTSTYFKKAQDEIFYESPLIVEGYEKLYGEESIFNFVNALVDDKAASSIFQELIYKKNGVTPEVQCIRTEFILDGLTALKQKPLLNQLLSKYFSNNVYALTAEHARIIQLRTDLIDVLELDCN